jgi:protein-tyrosine-phosphatase
MDLLARMNYPTAHLRSKTWDEFAGPGAPHLDFVFTVCDQAAGEVCPIWPGRPMNAHWGFPDPSQFTGSEAEIHSQVADLFRQMSRVLGNFAALPIRSLDRLALKRRLDDLAREGAAKQPK